MRKSKFINCSCKENDKKMFTRDNVNDKKKSILKIESNKRKKTKDSNLNDNEKEQIRKYEKTMCNNLDDEQKKTMKNKGQQKKKANRDNLNVDERNS